MVVQSLVYLTVLIHSYEVVSIVVELTLSSSPTLISASVYPQVFWMKGTFVDSLLS